MSQSDIAIVGAGFGGLGAAIRLTQRGVNDFVVFDQGDEVGGTWRDNAYPGCACDVPSHLYSYSFARNPEWSDTFSGQAEIWSYLKACVRRFGLEPHLRLGHAVTDIAWDDETSRWRVTTARGEHLARVLVLASGPLSVPSIPDIPGLESFAGKAFHSAQWDHKHDLTGARVAVIGTGASAIQFVPAIAPRVGSLTVFQRTPAWVLPRRSRRIGGFERAIYRLVPGAQRLLRTLLYWGREAMGIGFQHPRVNRLAQRLAQLQLRRQVGDEALRAKLTPDYVLGCKRVLLSNDYLPTLTRSNVDVVTDPIVAVRPDSVVTADGRAHPVDTVIFGTGFHVTDFPMMHHVRGRAGQTLAQAWSPSMRAHRGTTIAGFPNLFVLLGPNTGLGHTSVVLMIESQLRHILDVLAYQHRQGIAAVEPTPEAQQRWNDRVDARMARTVWSTGGCRSWYVDAAGRNSTLWPGFATGFRLRLRRFRATDYRPVPAHRPEPVHFGR